MQNDEKSEGAGPEPVDADERTKARLKRVALELFSEKGYSATSMREIAEQLGVTKAALYYHYPSKEDIVRSLLADYMSAIDALVAWATTEPRPSQAEVLTHWAELVQTEGVQVVRFVHGNQHVLHELEIDKNAGLVAMQGLFDVLAGPDASVERTLRARMAVFSMHMAAVTARELNIEDSEVFRVSLDVALDVLG
jgi:AcrR family transcriptional regulator